MEPKLSKPSVPRERQILDALAADLGLYRLVSLTPETLEAWWAWYTHLADATVRNTIVQAL